MSSRRATLGLGLLFPVAILAYGGFASVMDAVLISGGSVFLAPALWFSVLLVVFALGSVLWREMPLRLVASMLLVLPSLFFVPSIIHAGIILIAVAVAFGGILRTHLELRSRVRLSVYRSAGAGLSQILFAVALVVSSQYYAHISTLSWQRLVPSFDLGEGMGAWMIRTAGTLSPSLEALQNEEISVDGFLNQLRQKNTAPQPVAIDPVVIEQIQVAEITQSRKELSRLLGREVGGEEKMNDILSEVLRKKTVAFFSGGTERENLPVPLLPFFLTVLLFFTIYPLGSFLAPLILGIMAGLFTLAVRVGLVTLHKVSTEQDVIV